MPNKIRRFVLLLLVAAMVLPMFCTAYATSDALKSSPNAVSLKKAKITVRTSSGTYNRKIQDIPIKVTLNGKVLKEGVDFVVSGNETSGSTAKKYKQKIVIVGIGHYKGYVTKTVSYTIKKTSQTLSVAETTITASAAELKKASQSKKLTISDKVLGAEFTGRKLVWKTTAKITASQSGVIKLPKGLKKGTYYIKVYAKSGTNYAQSAYKKIKIVVS